MTRCHSENEDIAGIGLHEWAAHFLQLPTLAALSNNPHSCSEVKVHFPAKPDSLVLFMTQQNSNEVRENRGVSAESASVATQTAADFRGVNSHLDIVNNRC